MRAYENSITVDLHCVDEGEWSQERLLREQFSEFCRVKLNPARKSDDEDAKQSASAPVAAFADFVAPFLVPQSVQQALPPSDVVGNIRFR